MTAPIDCRIEEVGDGTTSQMRTNNIGVPDEVRIFGGEELEGRQEGLSNHNQARNGKMDREKE